MNYKDIFREIEIEADKNRIEYLSPLPDVLKESRKKIKLKTGLANFRIKRSFKIMKISVINRLYKVFLKLPEGMQTSLKKILRRG